VITFTQKGSFKNTERYLAKLSRSQAFAVLSKYGEQGVNALSNATPVESGETAAAWSYTITQRPGYYSIRWHNSHVNEGRPIAILIQYGHGTRNGGYVQGRDYINPAVRPIFDRMTNDVWKEVITV
jgi:hypothetical protein